MTEAERNKQFTVRETEVDTLEFCVQIHKKSQLGSNPETVHNSQYCCINFENL